MSLRDCAKCWDYPCTCGHSPSYGLSREAERAAIVKWLRDRAGLESCWEYAEAADRIDAREHLK